MIKKIKQIKLLGLVFLLSGCVLDIDRDMKSIYKLAKYQRVCYQVYSPEEIKGKYCTEKDRN